MLDRLLRPRSIAVIGGGAWCNAVVEQNRKFGFAGNIWPVHPSRERVGGIKAFQSLDDLPAAPDAAFIGVNRNATIQIVRRLQSMQAGGAICFASGFKEATDGASLQEDLLLAAGDMPILGPNCYGALNALDQIALWPDQHGLMPAKSGVAIISQSSNIAINLTMQKRGLPIAYVITIGNQAQQGISDIATTLLNDDRVTALGLYIESFGDIAQFEAMALHASKLGKPIVAYKVGRSEEARRATLTHTASVAGISAGADALMARLGIANAASLAVMIETLKVFHCHGKGESLDIASLSCSGGEAAVMADTAHRAGLAFPPLNTTQQAELARHLSPAVQLVNPLDYHTDIWRNKAALVSVFSAIAKGDAALTIIVLDFPRSDICDADEWAVVVDAIITAADATGKRFAVLASLPENMPEEIATRLIEHRIVPLCDFDQACTAIHLAASISAPVQQCVPAPPPAKTKSILSEASAKVELEKAGLDTPEIQSGLSKDKLNQAASTIGYPVVLKGENIAHKTEVGAVVLNIKGPQELQTAAAEMSAETYLVEEMINHSIAELLIGIVADPAHGFVLTLAAGGTLTELLDDKKSLLLPATAGEIDNALKSLKVDQLLNGYRGGKCANRPAIIQAVSRLQQFVIDNQHAIVEVEINPLICTDKRAIVADALIVKGTP